jgi:L-alanine-DL-glutamate epimerase-like enolase superfamily enzyme
MPTIRAVDVNLIELKFDKPVGGSGVSGVDIVVVKIFDTGGGAGLGFSYVIGGGAGGRIASLCASLADAFLVSKPCLHPSEHWAAIKKSFNRTGDGPNLLALAALDVANWDLKSHQDQTPLCVALGGAIGKVPVYASGGFSPNAAPEESAALALSYIERGYYGIKPRVNARPDDEKVLAAVRNAIGDKASLMADANEKGDVQSASRLLACAADYRAAFIEEPLPAGDPLGLRTLAALAKRAPIATGEHLQGFDRFATTIADGVASFIQPDLAMAGGLTPCLEVARFAAQHGVTVAPHFLPGLFVHLNGAFGGNLLLEEFPLIEPAFDGWPAIDGKGMLVPSAAIGHGLSVSEKYARK